MRVLRTLDELAGLGGDVYLAIGVFDGVHLGHQRVIGQARDNAKTAAGVSAVLTFDPHPMRVLRPDQAPLLLTSTAHKLVLIRQLDVDACLLVTFDKTFSETSAEKFIERIASCRQVCVGTRFRFGHDRAGNVALMEKLAPRYGFTVKEIKSVLTTDGEMISSTAVRQHVLAGNLAQAAAMLGRPFAILGTVEPGDQVGRELGFPTANVNPQDEAVPPNGVYAVRVRLVGQASRLSLPGTVDSRDGCPTTTIPGIINIGVRPTFEGRGRHRVIEVHLLDFDRDIYGQDLEITFAQKLRDEQKFASVEALKQQIADDEEAARKLLG